MYEKGWISSGPQRNVLTNADLLLIASRILLVARIRLAVK